MTIRLLRMGSLAPLVLASTACGPAAEGNRAAEDIVLDGIPVFEPAIDWPRPLPEHNIYVAEADPGRRWQKLVFAGTRPTGR